MKIKIDGQWFSTVTGKNQETHKTAPLGEYIGVPIDSAEKAKQIFSGGKIYETDSQDIPLVKCYGIDISKGIILKMTTVHASTPE